MLWKTFEKATRIFKRFWNDEHHELLINWHILIFSLIYNSFQLKIKGIRLTRSGDLQTEDLETRICAAGDGRTGTNQDQATTIPEMSASRAMFNQPEFRPVLLSEWPR